MSCWPSRLALLSLCCHGASAWPNLLLQDQCKKGLELLDAANTPPPIMGAVPTYDQEALGVATTSGCNLAPNATVGVGERLTLTLTSHQLVLSVFVVSSGNLEAGQPCGADGAQLSCTTCGSTGHQKHASWTPTRAGPATVALGAARSGFGTPAVTIAAFPVQVSDRGHPGAGPGGAAHEDQDDRPQRASGSCVHPDPRWP